MGSKSYIDRDAVVDLINRNKDLANLGENEWIKDECVRLIHMTASADVTSIIKCKKCKHFFEMQFGSTYRSSCMHNLGLKTPTQDTWCCWGERKGGEK